MNTNNMITKEGIQQIREISEKLATTQEYINIELPNIKEAGKEATHKLTRNGQEQDIAEQFLWEEVFHLGLNGEAGQILSAKYPELFAKAKEQEELVKQLEEKSMEVIGFSFRQMTLLNLIDLIVQVKEL